MNRAVYEESFVVRANEVGGDKRMRPDSLVGLLQEIAGNHANQLNLDILDLQGQKVTWVLHQLHMSVNRYPDWRDTITIRTWPSSGDGLRAYRDFEILSSDGVSLGAALSYWLIMDLHTRKPLRIPQHILDLGLNNEHHLLPVSKERMNVDPERKNGMSFQVHRTDVDLNKHANNVAYIRWILESVDHSVYMNQSCRELNIQFKSEAELNDRVKVYSSRDGSTFTHQIEKDGQPIATGRSEWS